jgi:hypothetical protein
MNTKDHALDLALEALERLDGWLALRYGSGLTPQEQQVVTSIKQARSAPEKEPIGYLFQHEETGLTTVVDVQQVEWGFEKNT